MRRTLGDTHVNNSYGIVPRVSASASTEADGPKISTSSPTDTPCASVTSIMHRSMHMLPIVGHATPRTTNEALPRPRRRLTPSAYPTGTVATTLSRDVTPRQPYPTGVPAGQCLSDIIRYLNVATGCKSADTEGGNGDTP